MTNPTLRAENAGTPEGKACEASHGREESADRYEDWVRISLVLCRVDRPAACWPGGELALLARAAARWHEPGKKGSRQLERQEQCALEDGPAGNRPRFAHRVGG